MSQEPNSEKELMRVLSNPDNLIISEALLDRLPGESPKSQTGCLVKFGQAEYSGSCLNVTFNEESLFISLVLHSDVDKFEFLDSGIPCTKIFKSKITVVLSSNKESKIFSGIPKQISYDQTPTSECTMSLELYNYSLEDSHE